MDKKITGVVAYLTWIGLLVAYIAGDREGAKFHLNQALVILLAGTLLGVLTGILSILSGIPLLGWIVAVVVGLISLVGGIFLFIQVKVIHLLVRPDIQGTDNHLPAGHQLRHLAVNLELLLLRGIIALFQIQKFAAEQADALRVITQSARDIGNASDIGVQTDLLPVRRHRFLSFQLKEQPGALLVSLKLRLHLRQRLLIRIHQEGTGIAVHHGQLSVPLLLNRNADQRRNVHGPGQDRRVGIGGSVLRHKGKELGLVHLHRLAGSQILCHNNNRLVAHIPGSVPVREDGNHPLGYILDVSRSRPEIIVLHPGEHFGKIISCGGNGVFGVYFL